MITNYAAEKVKAIRADNANAYEAGEYRLVDSPNTQNEMDRVHEMNRSLCQQKRPERDLVKDTDFQVPKVSDPLIKRIIAGQDR